MSPAHPSRNRKARLTGLLAVAALVVGVGQALPASPAAADDSAGTAVSSPLPFDLPTPGVLRSSSRKVFAHYIGSLPRSLDNQDPATDYWTRNYLSPAGEGGKFAGVGGFVRDRPIGRPPLTGTDWRLQDMKAEVRQAVSAGIDGFTFDVLQVQGGSVPQLWTNANLMLQAAAATDPGFKIMLMPDMYGSLGSKDVATVAQSMAALGRYPSAYRLADGRLVISPFKAEAHTVAWWSSFMATMKNTYGMPVALLPVFVANEQNYAAAFAPISYGMSSWGSRNPAWNNPDSTSTGSQRDRAARVKALGQKWMQPVSVQDERPTQGIYDEAENTTNLRDTWQLARATNAEFVQIPTWNDDTEGTTVQPSLRHGWSLLDISAYYLSWYKTGVAPPVVRDTVYVTHRRQLAAALPSYPETRLMQLRGGSPTRDTVEALTFMTAPGTVTVAVGSKSYLCAVAAGVDTCTVPLGVGRISASTTRGGVTTAAVSSPDLVAAVPYVQDLQYVAASSRRTPGTPVPVSPATVVLNKSVSISAAADSYANAGAPGTNFGTSSSLSVRGSVAAASYLRFPVPTAPAGTVLATATLRLRTTSDPASGSVDGLNVGLTASPWNENTVTWNNRPAPGAPVAHIPAGTLAGTAYAAALSPAVVSSLAGGSALALTSSGSDETRFWSANYAGATARPQLVLSYRPVVGPPANLAPSSPAKVVSTVAGDRVVVSWAASVDDHAVTGYQLQRTTVSGFPATAAVQVQAVSGTSWTATPGVGTWYYRVLAVDAAGSRSAPSPQTQATVKASVQPGSGVPTVQVVTALGDTYANAGAPLSSFGASASLSARGRIGAVSYLRFALPAAPSGMVLRAASLRVRTTMLGTAGSADRFTVHRVAGAWSDAHLTWRSRPALKAASLGMLRGALIPSTSYSAPLSAAAMARLVGSTTSFALTGTGTDSLWFWSSNHANSAYRPQLVLTWVARH